MNQNDEHYENDENDENDDHYEHYENDENNENKIKEKSWVEISNNVRNSIVQVFYYHSNYHK